MISVLIFFSVVAKSEDYFHGFAILFYCSIILYMKQFLGSVYEILEVVAISLFTVFIIRTYLVQPFLVSGASMDPNFSNGNYLIIDELSYRFRDPVRGEVVVFKYPGDKKTFYIKRIIGLPSEQVVVSDGSVKIYNQGNKDGFMLSEEYLNTDIKTLGNSDMTLGKDEYFVLGDNRNQSFDSRNWGSVSREAIIGITRVRLLPVTKVSLFETPQYN